MECINCGYDKEDCICSEELKDDSRNTEEAW